MPGSPRRRLSTRSCACRRRPGFRSSARQTSSWSRRLDPAAEDRRQVVRLLERGHVAAVLDDLELAVGQAFGHALGLLELAQTVLAAGDDQRRAGDALEIGVAVLADQRRLAD